MAHRVRVGAPTANFFSTMSCWTSAWAIPANCVFNTMVPPNLVGYDAVDQVKEQGALLTNAQFLEQVVR